MHRPFALAFFLALLTRSACGQTPPEIGYLFPAGGAPGQTVEVRIGGYNWTPDMQIFVHDPRVKLEVIGPPGPVIVPEPPYWFGKKARDNDFPLPREFPARLTIAADAPPGLIRWQAANANGAAAAGVLWVAPAADLREERVGRQAQKLPSLPCSVAGQVVTLEEVDRYTFAASRAGPITLDLWTRRLKSKMNAVVEVRDASGRLVADGADTAGHDLQLTFAALPGAEYSVSVYDVDFRGNRSFVYRLCVHDGPRAVAAIPAAGRRGQTRSVEFWGYGLATGQPALESVTRDVAFPSDPKLDRFDVTLSTPFGTALPFPMGLSDLEETREPAAAAGSPPRVAVPFSLTGVLDERHGEDRFLVSGKTGEVWSLACQSAVTGVPLDPAVTIYDPMGKELARADDQPGSVDGSLLFTVPADGTYQLAVTDSSGMSGTRAAAYRLAVQNPAPGVTLTVPEILSLPLGGKAPLAVKITRPASLTGPVTLSVSGLPAGVTLPADLVVPADKTDVNLELACAADAAVTAGMLTITASAAHNGQTLNHAAQTLAAITMKPRVKLTPEGLDDVRKWPRGSTYPAPVLVERLEGFSGEVLLEQTAHQQRVRQGLTGPDFLVARGLTRVDYPVFLPEWLETTKTSRIILNGVTQVPDPKGTVRHLVSKMELRIGMLPVGAMLKLSHADSELTATPGQPFEIPLAIVRSFDLAGPATLELRLPAGLEGKLAAEPLVVPAASNSASLRIVPRSDAGLTGEHELTIRATVMQGQLPVISETTVVVAFP